MMILCGLISDGIAKMVSIRPWYIPMCSGKSLLARMGM